MKKTIGGYFELELTRRNYEYHPDAIKLNSGRNALEYILLANKYTKVFIPYFTCDVILQPLIKNNIPYEFYHISNDLKPLFNFSDLEDNEGFIYTNYFGIMDKYINTLSTICKNLIIDNAQAFFSKPLKNVDTFYSARKFFGVADGAYLYINKILTDNFEEDISYLKMEYLLKRIDISAEDAYAGFKSNEKTIENQSIKKMSRLTKAILNSVDYESVKQQRTENFNFIHQHLDKENLLTFNVDKSFVPFVYPFRTKKTGLKEKLLTNRIYCATYWRNVFEWCAENHTEYALAKEIVYLPIDQRYHIDDMETILKLITE